MIRIRSLGYEEMKGELAVLRAFLKGGTAVQRVPAYLERFENTKENCRRFFLAVDGEKEDRFLGAAGCSGNGETGFFIPENQEAAQALAKAVEEFVREQGEGEKVSLFVPSELYLTLERRGYHPKNCSQGVSMEEDSFLLLEKRFLIKKKQEKAEKTGLPKKGVLLLAAALLLLALFCLGASGLFNRMIAGLSHPEKPKEEQELRTEEGAGEKTEQEDFQEDFPKLQTEEGLLIPDQEGDL